MNLSRFLQITVFYYLACVCVSVAFHILCLVKSRWCYYSLLRWNSRCAFFLLAFVSRIFPSVFFWQHTHFVSHLLWFTTHICVRRILNQTKLALMWNDIKSITDRNGPHITRLVCQKWKCFIQFLYKGKCGASWAGYSYYVVVFALKIFKTDGNGRKNVNEIIMMYYARSFKMFISVCSCNCESEWKLWFN